MQPLAPCPNITPPIPLGEAASESKHTTHPEVEAASSRQLCSCPSLRGTVLPPRQVSACIPSLRRRQLTRSNERLSVTARRARKPPSVERD